MKPAERPTSKASALNFLRHIVHGILQFKRFSASIAFDVGATTEEISFRVDQDGSKATFSVSFNKDKDAER